MDTRDVDSIKRTSGDSGDEGTSEEVTRGPWCSCLSLLKLLDKGTEVSDLSFCVGDHLSGDVAKRS